METIRNFVQLTDRIGTAGQPTPEQFSLIAENGYSWVINLAMPDHADALVNEGELVTREGMGYLHIPVPFKSPAPVHVRQFCRLLKSLLDEEPHQKVFVHCIMNYRISAFMFHYFTKVEGRDPALSRSPMFESWTPDPVWSDLLEWDADKIGMAKAPSAS
ncbi:protein tyrosine phosphatase family protein [Marinobacter nanhaiticus D15-8W]|uniref:Phosphatase n=1 Tax=Marinobacter nanhaiticus D15-8W TaxID=626887 RepID=N6X3Z7_9GAMM|nr:protein tyrosine phosphatase family protein [Marinobacter nanhaiticus]ENO15793.1 phosphatase [Marinobacter nanhaiticus D15-8W]BES73349.1 protein tyrosine phosphatase family protein [Marinobacter nanhaiticus D15-8W]